MPQSDKYPPGEALIKALSQKNAEIFESFIKKEKSLPNIDDYLYLAKLLDRFALTAPSTVIDLVLKKIFSEWKELVKTLRNPANQDLIKAVSPEARKLFIKHICLILLNVKKDLHLKDLQFIYDKLQHKKSFFSVRKLKKLNLEFFYCQTIKKLFDTISNDLAD